MRTIKFRAWHKKKETMYPVVGLDWIKMECWLQDGDLDPRVAVWYADMEKVELMQFTGLLDKNGKEIYEGDVVKHSYGTESSSYTTNISAVKWDKGIFMLGSFGGWWSEEVNNLSNELLDNTKNKLTFEVIGNIHENTELLQP